MTKSQVSRYKEFAIGIAVRAGTILMRNFNDSFRVPSRQKDRNEFVTNSDREVHRFAEFKIQQQFPDHNFLSEEGPFRDRDSAYTWVLDPLDGTLNYMIRNPFFCTSLTLLEDNVPLIGVIYAPYNREMFVAERGRSVRLNERNIHVSQERQLQNAVLAFGYFSRDKKSRAQSLKVWSAFEDHARAMRHLGCTSLELANVACGRMEAQVLSPPLRLWDIASGMLMVEQAGGRISNFTGKKWGGLHDGLVASNGVVHRQILSILKR